MNKFIEVSLTLLIVASLTSAVVIESPASHMDILDELARELTAKGFVSGAIVDARNIANVRVKTNNFASSASEIRVIVDILNSRVYYIHDQLIVLGGVTYKEAQKDWRGLVAENGDAGIVASEIDGGFWLVGVYDGKLSKDKARDEIRYAAMGLIAYLRWDLERENRWGYMPYH